MVLPRRRRRGHHRQEHLGLRHGDQHGAVRDDPSLREPRAARGHARSRVPRPGRLARQDARRDDVLLRVRQHGGHRQLHPPHRARLVGHPLPGAPAGDLLRGHPPRPAPRRGAGAPAGGAGDPRRQPDVRRALPPRRASRADPLAHGRADARADRDRHDQVLGPRVRGGGQPAHEPAARRAGADRRRDVHRRGRGRSARRRLLQAPDPRGARPLPPGHPRARGPARASAGSLHRRARRPRQGSPGRRRDDADRSRLYRGGRRGPRGLPGPRRSPRRPRRRRADLALSPVLPARRLPGGVHRPDDRHRPRAAEHDRDRQRQVLRGAARRRSSSRPGGSSSAR